MACFNPLYAVDYSLDPYTGKVQVLNSEGKHIVKFLGSKACSDIAGLRERYMKQLMFLPCGHCLACAQDYSRTWQARIMCEAMYHEKSCFLTLTYSKNPPKKPKKEHLRKFIKDVRNKYGEGIKFFGCGELGSLTARSHYHLILFGVDFKADSQVVSKRGLHYVERSETAEKIWNRGFVSIGDLGIDSAGYVAQYCNKKKIHGQDDGEFIIMSRGLGKRYFKDHYDEIFSSDFLYFAGNRFKIPRYFLKLALNEDDFIFKTSVWDYQDRKREIAQGFKYNTGKSMIEEVAMKDTESIKLRELKEKEGLRDVY